MKMLPSSKVPGRYNGTETLVLMLRSFLPALDI